jgi:rSAM/selenodomain-associated transferase 1
MKAIVVMMAKEPVATQVKTRLCPHLSPAQAAEIYTLFVQDMAEEMSGITEVHVPFSGNPQSSVRLALAYSPKTAQKTFEAILPIPMLLFPQQGADLGERLNHIFTKLHGAGYEQVHIINSDSPDMPCSLIRESTRLLNIPQVDLVLGPCADGGYYLVGLKKPIPELFQEIPWSTDRVLALTVARARALGLTYVLLQPWYDIDTCDDLVTFLNRNQNRKDGRGPGWRTFNYLKEKQIAAHLGAWAERQGKEQSQ